MDRMEFNLYSVNVGNIVPAAVRIIDKIYSSGKKCIFYSPSEDMVDATNKALWTFSTNAFVPHGDKDFGFHDKQPVYFAKQIENPNNATVVVLVGTFDYEHWSNFEKIIFVFESNTDQKIVKNQIQDLKKNNKYVNYWSQLSKGWEKLL